MTDTLRLSAFALPPTFPPESVPDACTCFVRECVPGLTKRGSPQKTENKAR